MQEVFSLIQKTLGKDSEELLAFDTPLISKELLQLPSKHFFENVFAQSDRSKVVRANLRRLRDHGRLKGTGYLSILPVDQGIEHSAGASFATNPLYFDPKNIVKLAIEGGCNAVASSAGVLGAVSGRYADSIPFIVKLNHNDLLRFPNTYDETLFASVRQAVDMGAVGVGATIYFGSPESAREIEEISAAFAEAHRQGLFTVLWCYLRNPAFVVEGIDYHDAADLTGQANHLGATLGADIVKQKLPLKNGGYKALNKGAKKFGKFDARMYSELASEHPIDLCRYQVLNSFAGRIGLINSGGESGKNDVKDAVYAAVVNKRAGGMGLIMGRKAFQKPLEEGIKILNAVQDVYLCKEITIV